MKNRIEALERLLAGDKAKPVIVFKPMDYESDFAEQMQEVERAKHAALGVVIDVCHGFEVWRHGVLTGSAKDNMPA